MGEKTETTHKRKSEAAKLAQATLATGAKDLQATVQQTLAPKRGQPTTFTQEKWDAILECVASYGDLIEICQRPDMPSHATLYRWMRDNPKLKDDMRGAWEAFSMIGHSVNNNILRGGVLSTGDFRRDEALASQNRWFMSKTNRRDFGDKVQVEHTVQEPFILEGTLLDNDTDDGV